MCACPIVKRQRIHKAGEPTSLDFCEVNTPKQRADILPLLFECEQSRFHALPTNVLVLVELFCVAVYHEDIDVIEFYVSQRGLAWRFLRGAYTPRNPHMERVTGSKLAALIGFSRHSSLPRDVFRAWTGRLLPNESTVVEPNDVMGYGTEYEYMIRLIFIRLVCPAREPGFYLMARRPNMGVSPDGVTPRIRVHGVERFLSPRNNGQVISVPFDRMLDACVVEIKASPYGLKECLQLEHVVQGHHEMFITKRRYCFFPYWHDNKLCLSLLEFCDSFWQCVERRLALFLGACERMDERLPPALEPSYGRRLQEEWFDKQRYPLGPRPKQLQVDWPPERPRYWLLLLDNHSRTTEYQSERLFDGRCIYPVHHPEGDPWYQTAWKPIHEEVARNIPQPCAHWPRTLQITRVEIVE